MPETIDPIVIAALAGLFGLLIILVVTVAPGGLVGTGARIVAAIRRRFTRIASASPAEQH